MKKALFAFTAMFIMIGMVFAAEFLIDRSGTLTNTVNGNSTSRNKIEDTATFGDAVSTKMYNLNSFTGINSEGGIRVKTIAKKLNLGIVTNTQNMFIPVYKDDGNSSSALFTYNTKTNKLRITWENWTGNTSFNARFTAKNNN